MKIILVGLGRFGREILKRLIEDGHRVLVIENDPQTVEEFLKKTPFKGNEFKILVGDASSVIVWEYLPLEEYDLIVSSLRNDVLNKTICRIVREVLKNWEIPLTIFSLYRRYEDFYANYNCRVIYLPEVAANVLEGFLFKNIVKPIAIGLGKNELLEVTVSPRSPYVGLKLDNHRLRHWRIALLYKGEQVILPPRKITLHAGDRVILVGDQPRVVLEVAKSMALGQPQFPLSFGENLITVLRTRDLHYLKEYHYLWKHTRVKNIVLFTTLKDKSKLKSIVSDKSFLEALLLERGKDYSLIFEKKIQNRFSAGIISVPLKKSFLFFTNVRLKNFFKQETPFLLPKLTFPYRKILVSLNTDDPAGLIEPVFELARLLKSEVLNFVHVSLPQMLESSTNKEKISRALELIEHYSSLYGLKEKVKIHQKVGNPLKLTLPLVKENDLLVVGFKPNKNIGWFEPYTPYLLAKESTKTVLGIPT